jgi:hypothetical protein
MWKFANIFYWVDVILDLCGKMSVGMAMSMHNDRFLVIEEMVTNGKNKFRKVTNLFTFAFDVGII